MKFSMNHIFDNFEGTKLVDVKKNFEYHVHAWYFFYYYKSLNGYKDMERDS